MSYVTTTIKLDILWGHCDPAGIVFNSRFFEFFDQATWHMLETVLAIPRAKLYTHFDIVAFPLVEAGATFKIPLAFGDTAELQSTILEFSRSSFLVRHHITKDGALAVDGSETRVWAGRDPSDPARMRSKPIPAEMIERFKIG